jgi:hypothetical protein
VISFWVFAALALFGAIRRGRAVPAFVWAVPLLMYLSFVSSPRRPRATARRSTPS